MDIEQLLKDIAGGLGAWTYLLIGGLAFAETGAFIGLVVPGEFAVLLGGVIAGHGDISVFVLLGVVWFAAWAGDSVSFALGARLGRGFVLRHGYRLRLPPERFARVEGYFAHHGGKTILVGRFIGLVRALAPFIAGSSGMRYRHFLPFCLLGTGLWSSALVLLGYFFWQSLDTVSNLVGKGLLAFGLLVFTVVGVVLAVRYLRVPENRARFLAFTTRTPGLRWLARLIRAIWVVVGRWWWPG
jgi:membrane protein DedA with SNARE-associated domain